MFTVEFLGIIAVRIERLLAVSCFERRFLNGTKFAELTVREFSFLSSNDESPPF